MQALGNSTTSTGRVPRSWHTQASCCTRLQRMSQAHSAAPTRRLQQQRSGRGRRCSHSTAALSPAGLFMAATVTMVPVYALLVACPSKWRIYRVLTSHALPVLLSIAWVAAVCLAASTTDSRIPDVLAAYVGTFHANMATIAAMFTKRWFTCLAWTQLLLLDFVLAREVALDAADLNVFAAHSLVLCFMCGPVGYLSHQLTKAVYAWLRPDGESAAAPQAA